MKVSVCIPIYGVEKYIERCAVSLFEQTYQDLEFVFVNDCTRDSSISILNEVIRRYPNRYAQIKIINHDVNRGLAAARNTAVANCKGEFILHVDSDDYIDIDLIEHLVQKQMEGNYDIVSCGFVSHFISSHRKEFLKSYDLRENLLNDIVTRKAPCHIWGRLIRLKLYRDHEICTHEGIDMGEDFQVMPLLVYFAQFVNIIDSSFYHYDCSNPQSYSNNFSESKVTQTMESILSVKDFFLQKKELGVYSRLNCIYLEEISRDLINSAAFNTNKQFVFQLQKKAQEIDSSYLKFVPFQYRITLYIKNYRLLKIYACFGLSIKKLLKFISQSGYLK